MLLDDGVWSGYVWSAHSAEYGLTGSGCQSCSFSDEEKDMHFPLSLFASENLVSRDRFGRPVSDQPAHSPHSD